MRLSISVIAVALLFHVGASAQPANKSGLTRLLEAEIGRFAGPGGPYRGGIYIKQMGTGEEAGVRADEAFESASTIKMAVLVMSYQLADQKKLNLADRYIVKTSDFRGGGIIRLSDPGLNPTYHDILMEMVITSNNAATDIMIAKVGGVAKVNEWLKQSGYNVLRLNYTTFDYTNQRIWLLDPKYKSFTPADIYALQNNKPTATMTADMIKRINAQSAAGNIDEQLVNYRKDQANWFGVASPSEMGRLLEGIERDAIASKEACEEMKRMMRAQQSGTRKIPHYLNVPVAHKTGETSGVTNDVGMIYAKSGPIIIALYSQGYTGLVGEADARLGAVARLVVEYFDGAS